MELIWRKSSRSGGGGGNGGGGDCVEVAFGPHGALLRDSKNHSDALNPGPAAFVALLDCLKRSVR